MKYNLFKILFLISPTRINKKGLVPLLCRITYDGERKQFATGLFVNPKHWDSKRQIMKPPNDENNFVNNELSLITKNVNQAFLFLQVQENIFSIEDIHRTYKGEKPIKETGLIQFYNTYLQKSQKLIGIEIKQQTWDKFSYIKADLAAFVLSKFEKSDFALNNLDLNFILEFEYYLKTEKHHKQVTINKSLQRFKKVIKQALNENIIESYPFSEHKPKTVKKVITFLTEQELTNLENFPFSQERLTTIRDMFILCCYTGLAYNEMSNLRKEHIIKGFDGQYWIKMIREKTGREISVPLLSKSAKIIEKFSDGIDDVKLLPVISNQKFNSYLKEIAGIVGIDKNLTHHLARRTFATTILLYNDIPMEIVSELLGHSKITITQEHYAKVVQKKVSEHMIELGRKLKR
jgi:site-specific recombinase XerD